MVHEKVAGLDGTLQLLLRDLLTQYFDMTFRHVGKADAWIVRICVKSDLKFLELVHHNRTLVRERGDAIIRNWLQRKPAVIDDPTPPKIAPGPVWTSTRIDNSAFEEVLSPINDTTILLAVAFWADSGSIGQVSEFKSRLNSGMSNLTRIYGCMKQTEIFNATLSTLLDSMTFGCIILDSGCRTVFANQAASAIGGSVAIARVRSPNGRTTRSLREVLATSNAKMAPLRCAGKEDGIYDPRFFWLAISDCEPIPIYLWPINRQDLPAGVEKQPPLFALIVMNNHRFIDEELLHLALGLTRVEAKLTGLVAGGMSVQNAANEMNVTEQTARTYLKRIFSKLGISRQSELVAAALQLSVPFSLTQFETTAPPAADRPTRSDPNWTRFHVATPPELRLPMMK